MPSPCLPDTRSTSFSARQHIYTPGDRANDHPPATSRSSNTQIDRTHQIKGVHRSISAFLNMYPSDTLSLEESMVVQAAMHEIAIFRQHGIRREQLEKAAAVIAARDRMRALVIGRHRPSGAPQPRRATRATRTGSSWAGTDSAYSTRTGTKLIAATGGPSTWTTTKTSTSSQRVGPSSCAWAAGPLLRLLRCQRMPPGMPPWPPSRNGMSP